MQPFLLVILFTLLLNLNCVCIWIQILLFWFAHYIIDSKSQFQIKLKLRYDIFQDLHMITVNMDIKTLSVANLAFVFISIKICLFLFVCRSISARMFLLGWLKKINHAKDFRKVGTMSTTSGPSIHNCLWIHAVKWGREMIRPFQQEEGSYLLELVYFNCEEEEMWEGGEMYFIIKAHTSCRVIPWLFRTPTCMWKRKLSVNSPLN